MRKWLACCATVSTVDSGPLRPHPPASTSRGGELSRRRPLRHWGAGLWGTDFRIMGRDCVLYTARDVVLAPKIFPGFAMGTAAEDTESADEGSGAGITPLGPGVD